LAGLYQGNRNLDEALPDDVLSVPSGRQSKSQERVVKKYLAGQAEHHEKEDVKSELLRLLRAHEIEFDNRYVFD
jgi:hypothetical protein